MLKPIALATLVSGTLDILFAMILLANVPLLHRLLRGAQEVSVKTLPFEDELSGPLDAERYFTTGGYWRTREGRLVSPAVRNNPLWLKASLPLNVRIRFEARSVTAEGDVRVELFGDGHGASRGLTG